MSKFFVGYSNFATTTANKTAIKLIGATARKFEIVEVTMTGSGVAAPADVAHQCQVAFLTNTTSGTAVTPIPLAEKVDQGGIGSGLAVGTAYSAEPTTYNTNTYPLFGFNQRGGMRWGVPQGEGFKSDGGQTALSIGVLVKSSVAGAVDGQAFWWEP